VSSITIRKLDPALKERLRVRAAEHGHSIEAGPHDIPQSTLGTPAEASRKERTGADLIASIRVRFEPLGFVELELPPRGGAREPPKFD